MVNWIKIKNQWEVNRYPNKSQYRHKQFFEETCLKKSIYNLKNLSRNKRWLENTYENMLSSYWGKSSYKIIMCWNPNVYWDYFKRFVLLYTLNLYCNLVQVLLLHSFYIWESLGTGRLGDFLMLYRYKVTKSWFN